MNEDKNPPIANIPVPEKSMDEIRRLEPEMSVRVVLEGKVKAVDKRSIDEMLPGSIQIEVRKMRVIRDDNAFEDMAEDDA